MNSDRRDPKAPSRPQAATPLRERLQARLFEAPDREGAVRQEPPAQPTPAPRPARDPITIAELTDRLARNFAINFSMVCVMGEVSEVKSGGNAGHVYFTLKDAGASIDAMVWADQRKRLTVQPKQGQRVVAMGSIRVFAPRGRYSLHIEQLEAVGAGDLQRAFEALKARLAEEGLFDASRKRSLPTLLRTVGLVTSPTGAVRHDIERTLTQGGARVRLCLVPVRVQGEGAALEIAAAVRGLSARGDIDLIVVARGGGSLEELWPFNEEPVVRAIASSHPPVICAVGHETDVTLSDFAADHRASTPTGAAKEIVDIQRQAALRTESASLALHRAIDARSERFRRRLDAVSTHRVLERERTRLERWRSRLAETLNRARLSFDRAQAARIAVATRLQARCEAQAPHERFTRAHATLDRALLRLASLTTERVRHARDRAGRAFASRGLREAESRLRAVSERSRDRALALVQAVRPLVDRRRARFLETAGKLEALSPLAVLHRGYALATLADGRILSDVREVQKGDDVVVRLAKGRIRATVRERDEEMSSR